MANITRIKNNQITDSTITYSKIASGTLVGSVFNSNLTLNSNVTILGNLSVTGSSAIINAVNTTVNDPLVVFNNGYVGSPTYDIGVIANRNLSSLAPYGSVNMGFVWKEDAQQWQAIATTETGSTTGSINNSGWANVRVGNLVSVTSNITGAAAIGGTLTVSGTVSHLSTTDLVGATTFTTATGGGLQAAAIGNVTPGTGAFTSLTATGAITLNTISAASFQGVIGNVTPASGAFTTLTASGATTVTNSTASTSTSTGALVVTGGAGVGGALYAGTVYDNGNRVITGLTSSGNGNVTVGGTAPNLTVELTATGPGTSSWGGSTQLPYFSVDAYGRISAAGNVALNTIAVTNLGNTNEITANSTVGLTGLNLVATGVTAGNYGSALSIPTIVVDSKGRITGITTNALSTSFTVAGTSGTTSIDNGDTFTFAGTYGVTVAVGDTYANISTPQDLRTTANPTFNNLTAASVQGVIGNVTPASATFTTASTGGLQAVAIGNVTPGTGVFTTGTFNTTTTGGLQAVAIGNVTPGTGVFTTGTFNTATTGGLQAVAIGNVTPGTAVFTTLDSTGDTSLGLTDAVAINNTPIGNATPSTGAFTSLSASGATTLNTVTGASFQGVVGNVTPAAGTFTSLFADSASFASINNTPIGNATPSTGAFTTLSAQTITTGGLQAVAIGNVTPGTGAFTTLVTTNFSTGNAQITGGSATGLSEVAATTGTIDNFTSGNAQITGGQITGLSGGTGSTSAGTTQTLRVGSGGIAVSGDSYLANSLGINQNLSVAGWANVTNTTQSTNATTGAIITAGGVGIAKNLNVGGSVVIDGNLTVNGDVTTVSTATLDVEDLNITVAKGAGSAAAANGAGLTVDGANATFTYANTDDSWNVNKLFKGTSAAFNTVTTGGLQAVAIGNVTPGTGAFTSVTVGESSIGDGTVNTGIVTAGTANLTYLNVGNDATIGGVTTLATATAGGLQAKAIGNVTPGTGAFTTITAGGLQAAAIGNVTPGTGAFTTLSATGTTTLNTVTGASFQGAIGNVTPSSGAFTSGTFNTVNTGGLQAVAIGNVTPGTGAFTSVTVGESSVGDGTVNTGTVTAGTANLTYLNVGQASALNTVTAASLQATAIGNVTPGTGAFTTLSASTLTLAALNGTVIGNVTPAAGTFTTLTAQTTTTGGLQAVAIGNATPGSAVFTTLDSTGATTLGLTSAIAINNTPIGNATPSTGAFTTLSASGTTTLNTVTGASFQGVIGNVTPAAGTFTDLVADSLDVPAINGTVIGNVTPESGAFTTLTTTSTIISAGNIVADATTDSTSNVTGAMVVKGGLGVHGNINAGTAGTSVHAIRGNLLLGIGPVSSATTALVVNLNTTTPIPGRAQVHLTPGNDRDGTYLVDSYGVGVSSTFQGRHARGTLASPSAVQAGDQLGSFHAAGYGTTGYTNLTTYEPSGVTVWAAENYTDTAQGTYVTLEVIKTGTNAAVTGLKVDSTGNVVIPSLTHSIDYTTGALVVNGGAGFNGNIHANGDCHVAGSFNGTDVGITGGFRTTLDTDTTSPGTGVLVLPGGASIGGNTYVGKNLYIGPASFEKDLAVATIIGVDNGSSFAQMAMVNSAGSGSTDFAAYTANGNDAGGWVDMGIAGNAFSDANYTITNAQDGYLFTRPTDNSAGGNLVIATSEAGSHNDVVIGVGGFLAESEVARFHGNSSNSGTLVIKLPTNAAPAANTGAFQVWGGGSFSSNLYVGGAVTINGSQTANYDFKVAGKNTTNLLWARPSSTYDQVVIGDTLSTAGLVGGVKLLVNSTDSVILPKGTTGQRPGSSGFTDVAGMFRYNTTSNSLEFYNGSIWAGIGSNFTVITDEQFNGNGIDTEFTLSAAATTAACVVSINGVVQVPTLSYSISGATLTFTEAPANGDLIDVRVLVTTQMVAGIASENGFMGFQTSDTQAYITAGTDAATTVTYWDTSGAQVGSIPNVTVSTANVASTVDTFATATYRTAKYLLQATNGSNYQAMEALVIHDNTTATIVSYGIVQTGSNLGILNATVSSGNVLVQFVPAISNTKVRLSKDYLLV